MGRMPSDRCALAVIVTSLGDHSAELPVKNTFVHFSDIGTGCKAGCVQRSKTDPSSEARFMALTELPGMARSNVSSTTSGGSTPRAIVEDISSSTDTCAEGIEEWIGVSTPVSTPCWSRRVVLPSGSWVQPITCAPTLPSQVQVRIEWPASVAAQPLQCPAVNSTVSCPYTALSDGSVHFGFMLRRAEGVDWGLDVTRDENQHALLVDAVLPGGAIDYWNKQVMAGPKKDKALLAGDRIVSVNGKRDCQAMVHESKNSMLLKMEVLRLI